MGVTKDTRELFYFGYIEDELEQLENNLEDEGNNAESQRRRRRRRGKVTFNGSSTSLHLLGKKRMGANKARRSDNLRQLLNMVEKEDTIELDYDVFEPSMSAFAELFLEQDKMKAWNDFVNSTEEEQERIITGKNCCIPETIEEEAELDETWEQISDKRKRHPSYSAQECFQRIDKKIRTQLKGEHVPMRFIRDLEIEIIGFFNSWPDSVYVAQLASGFERMMLHAVCQYLDLSSQSHDTNGKRQTHVENKHTDFCPPETLLSAHLQKLS